jgi:hypothetical protein
MDTKKILIGLIILGIIGFLIWFVFFSQNINKTIMLELPTYIHTKYVKEIPSSKLPISEVGYKFTYSFWLYLKNIPGNGNWNTKYNKTYYILYRFGSPNVIFHPKSNLLRIFMTYKDLESDIVKDYIDIENLSLQQWQNIVIVLDDKKLDVYLNGEINNSLMLKNIPFIYNRPLLIGQKNSNFNGHVAKLEYYNDALDHNQIASYYQSNKDSLPKDMLSYSEEYYINKSEL